LVILPTKNAANLYNKPMNYLNWQGQIHRYWLKFTKPIKHAWNQPDSLFRYIAFLSFLGVMFFSFALISNLFTIPLSGDYVLQQIPFYLNGYDDWWHFFKTGEFVLWDHSTYIGSNHIGSNSFYYYLNPFFFPILVFPRFLVPQGLAILMIGKMVGASLAFRLYLKYMGVKEDTSRLFAMVYGFSGWMAYYLWFNHFMEVAVVFPLVLLGVEKLLKERKFSSLAFALFLMGITNYFFLVSTSFTAVFYAVFRFVQTLFKRSFSQSFIVGILGFLAFLVGLSMSAFVFLPSVMVAVTSNRVGEAWYLPKLLEYLTAEDWDNIFRHLTVWTNRFEGEDPYKKFYPLISFLFPTVSNRSSTLFRTGSYDNTISSLFIYTPLTLLLIPSLIHSIRKKRIGHLVGLFLILFMLFTPITYQLVHGFTIDYGRWQIFVVAIAIAYIAINFDERKAFKAWYFDVSFITMFSLALYALLVAYANEGRFFFTALEERAYVAYAALAYMVVVYFYLRKQHTTDSIKPAQLKQAIFFEAIVMGTLIMNIHGLVSYPNQVDNGLAIVNDQQRVIDKIKQKDDDFFRIYNLNSGESTNLGMRLGYNGVTAFHSLYNFHVMDFNNWSHMNYNYRGWSMGYHEKRYNLDTFLGIKYYVMQNVYDSFSRSADINPETGLYDYYYQNVPHGFVKDYQLSTNANSVYVNTNFIEGGFSFDNLIRVNQLEGQIFNDLFSNTTTEVLTNEEAYLSGGILDNADIEKIIEEAPHLEVRNIPFRNIQRIQAQVSLVTCDEIFRPENVANVSTCETTAVNNGASINQFEGERKTIHITPLMGQNFGEDPEHYFFSLQLRLSHFSTVYFFDQDNQIIVRDAHSFVNTSFKYMRGYYPNRPVSRIVIVPKFFEGSMFYPALYREPYRDYLNRLDALNEFPLENYQHSENRMTFTTDYPQARMIVLNTAFDPGWRVRRIDTLGRIESIPVYKAQGGFIGFLSGEGPMTYEVRYWTPYLTEGILISLTGFSIFAGITGAAWLIEKKQREKESLKS
jgi:uncharacterized membrane protein YfhO